MKLTWRTLVLGVLLLGPIAVYVGLGVLWLREQGWALYGFAAWLTAGLVFAFLSVRWTADRSGKAVLPPLDWEAPERFAPIDRTAWDIVENEARAADLLQTDDLTLSETYLHAGRRLATRLSVHYHPGTDDPLDPVPFADLLTALELATEDLGRLIREIPGGDLLTAGHLKTATQAAGWIQKFNAAYSYILPVIEPLTGLIRLSSQNLVTDNSWRGMRQNFLRWLYRAYVNRLGLHLVELYSGRLAMGAEAYRRLTRPDPGEPPPGPLDEIPSSIPPRFLVLGRDRRHAECLASQLPATLARWAEGHDLKQPPAAGPQLDWTRPVAEIAPAWRWKEPESASADDHTLRAGLQSDLILLLVRPDDSADIPCAVEYLDSLTKRLKDDPRLEPPPVVVVALEASPNDPRLDPVLREPSTPCVRVDRLPPDTPASSAPDLTAPLLGVIENLLPRIHRVALIRQVSRITGRSKAGRLFRQVGQLGRRVAGRLWSAQTERFRPSQPSTTAGTSTDPS